MSDEDVFHKITKDPMPLAVILSNVESLARETGRSIRSGAIQVYFRKLLEGK